MSSPAPSSPDAAIRVMRVIGMALGAGVTLFAAVAWFLHRDAPPPDDGTPLIVYLWLAFATSLVAGSLVVWRGRVVPHIEDSRQDWRERAARIHSGLVITWAMVEGAALFGVVLYFLEGHILPLVGGLGFMWAALALTWPRPAWLESEPFARR